MRRTLDTYLVEWSKNPSRKPLLIRGARQVGKSHLVNEFGRQFDHFLELNFEMEPALASLFQDSLDPAGIVEKIAIARNTTIVPGKTLLFLDEVQVAPRAVTALRYFYEKMPELHVIAAGSLVEFTLETVGLPVGRVSSLYLYPLSLREFLLALEKDILLVHIDRLEPDRAVGEPFRSQLVECFAQYMAVGGMPEAVKTWIAHRELKQVARVHHEIIDTYRQDFLKYSRKQQIHHVEKLFSAVPRLQGRKFVHAHVDPALKSREIKPAFDLLEMAQVVHRIRHSAGNGVPLEGECNDKLYKAIFLDVGLAQAALGQIAGDWILAPELQLSNKGAIAEAFVGQELLAYADPRIRKRLFYWVREQAHAQAEVDYLGETGERVIPVEVKSGSSGSLKSLLQFLKEKRATPYGAHVALHDFGRFQNIRQIPLFALWKLLAD